MVNTAKYLVLLEQLQFGGAETGEEQATRLSHDVNILKKFVQQDVAAIWKQLLRIEDMMTLPCDPLPTEEYVVYLLHVLLAIKRNTNFQSDAKEDLLSTRHVNLCIEAIQDVGQYGLGQQIHPKFCRSGVYKGSRPSDELPNYALLLAAITSLRELLEVPQFHLQNSMELVIRDFMAGIYSVLLGQSEKEVLLPAVVVTQLQENLNFVWTKLTKLEYFRNLLLLKGIRDLPAEITKKLHLDLLQRLQSKSGFSTFVATMLTANAKETESKHAYEVIARIVAFRGHTKRFQHSMLQQIFEYLHTSLQNQAMADSMGVGLLTLRRLYDLNEDNKAEVQKWLRHSIRQLHQPEDMLSGLIVMEHTEFCLLIGLWFNLFCTSIVECLPSDLLTPYLPLLLEMYYNTPGEFEQKHQIGSMITRCLNNRESNELEDILQKLYKKQWDEPWCMLHERVLILPNQQNTELTVKIASAGCKAEYSISLAIPELLMTSDFHILTYQVFMVLLQMMYSFVDEEFDSDSGESIDLLQSEEELLHFLNTKYPVKVEVILSLNTLISHQPLRLQLRENHLEFMKTLKLLIEQRVQNVARKSHEATEYSEKTLLIMLSLLQEMLESSGMPEAICGDLESTLQKLSCVTSNVLVLQRIRTLSSLLRGDMPPSDASDSTSYNKARALLEAKESHLQVWGIQLLIDLLRKKDPVTLSNLHVITALALSLLKDPESFTFLNCVRLFVGLVSVHEAEVLELLSDEYLNDTARMDYRLVVGEAILKVGQELGPLCYKYKDVLLNCFMHGARSKLDEFRMSSFANLSQLCRILSYQVHKFFQELLQLIDCELSTGKYVPAKRAAVLVLSELIAGMDNLMDFEEMLLPLYRLMKLIESNDQLDDKMRLHASNGLKALGEKCKSLLSKEQKLEKEIRIFGINDKPAKKNASILEIV